MSQEVLDAANGWFFWEALPQHFDDRCLLGLLFKGLGVLPI